MIKNLKQLINELTSYITSDYTNSNNIDIGISNTLSMYDIKDDTIKRTTIEIEENIRLLTYIVNDEYLINVITEIAKEDLVHGTILKVLKVEGDTID